MMKKSSIIKIVIMAIILVLAVMIISSFVRGFQEPVVFMDGNELIIKTSYGVTLNKSEINSVRLIDVIPPLTRGDGFGFGNTQKGQVSVSSLGEGLAYVKVPGPPYILLELNGGSGNYVFLNLHNADDTRVLFENIQAWLRR